jgi:pimeloyl-ACP methyl ester carboxylesterase
LKAQKLLDRHALVPLHKYKEISFFEQNKHLMDVKRHLLALLLLSGSFASAQQTLVIGFLGGFVPAGEPHHPEIKFIQDMDREHPEIDYALFSNHDVDGAYRTVLALKPSRIVLFGHSWGGAAAVDCARRLGKAGLLVEEVILIDGVSKPFHNHDDRVIPANVIAAFNFYQTKGRVHGRPVSAWNPEATMVSNTLWQPAKQKNLPWRGRFLSKGHAEIEYDPAIWVTVRHLILDCTSAKSDK